MLCDACKGIWSAVEACPPGSWSGVKPLLFADAQLEDAWAGAHHTESGTFLSAVGQRCYICCTIFRDLSAELRAQASLCRTFYHLTLSDTDCHDQDMQDHYVLEFTIEILQGRLPIAERQVLECTGSFKILPKTELSVSGEGLGLTEDTFTGKCKEQVKEWLRHCVQNHTPCNRLWSPTGPYPARLLDVARDGWFRLQTFEQGEQYPSYVTLSHCWDWEVEMPLKLTLNTLRDLKDGLETKWLTKRFREAIEIARWMGIDYIWIDALCIEQDSEEDWLIQSSLMGDIYAGSYCNIAVTSVGQDKGCFTSRYKDMVEPYSVPNPRSTDRASTHVIGYDDFWSNSLLDSPLHNRGWVLQERMLAPRTIHFGQEQMFWECRENKACEAYPEGIPVQFQNHKTRAWRQSDQMLSCESRRSALQDLSSTTIWQTFSRSLMGYWQPARQPAKPPSAVGIGDTWPKIVERFMECKLSVPGDKLVAISGIAQKVNNITGERYLAGLWENSQLPQSLLWYVLARRQADGTASYRTASMNRGGYRAPSWSWASLEAKVIWNWPAECEKVFISIQETIIKDVGNSKMGKISAATMKMKGGLFKANLSILDESASEDTKETRPKESGRYVLRLQNHRIGNPTSSMAGLGSDGCDIEESVLRPTVYLDTPLIQKATGVEVYMLPICSGWKGRSGNRATPLAGLLLERSKGARSENTFERIGIFGLDEEETRTLCRTCTINSHSLEEALDGRSNTVITLI